MRCHFSSGRAKIWILPSESILSVSNRGRKRARDPQGGGRQPEVSSGHIGPER